MFLGIEIGGTKLQLGVGNGVDAEFVALERLDIDASQGAQGIQNQIADVGLRLVREHSVQRVGYGFGGPLDAATGVITASFQIDGWTGFPLGQWTVDTLGVPTVLFNDCDAAALAEARYGAGRESKIVFYVTVGTGVGGGLVIDGLVHGRTRPAAAEIGHLRPPSNSDDCSPSVQDLASGRGLESQMRELLAGATVSNEDRDDLSRRCDAALEKLTGKDIAQAASEGNSAATLVVNVGVKQLGWGIAQMITLLAPEVVVVGGGVSLMDKRLFLNPLRQYVAEMVFPPLANTYKIVPAGLGEEVVVHGAIAAAAAT